MYSNKQIAEFKRQLSDLEAQRKVLKEECKNKRSTMTSEELVSKTEELRTINEQIDDLKETLESAPSVRSNNYEAVRSHEITAENFRSSTQYRDAFFRSYANKRVAEADAEIMAYGKRAITDMNGYSVTSGAEYLLPQTTMDKIQAIVVKYGALYGAVTKYNFNGDVTLPIGTADAPTNESNGTDTLTFTFTEVTINQQATVATVKVKNLLLKNSISGLEAFLAMEIGKYIGLQLENYVLVGNPASSKFQGIINAYGTSEKYTDADWELINDIYGALESPYGDAGTWIMKRRTFFKRFRSMTDAEGRPLISTLPVTQGSVGASQYFIDGRPVIFSTRMAEDAFIYGDLSQYIVNESQEIVIEADASAGFNDDATVWRGKVYSGGKPLFVEEAFVYYTKE